MKVCQSDFGRDCSGGARARGGGAVEQCTAGSQSMVMDVLNPSYRGEMLFDLRISFLFYLLYSDPSYSLHLFSFSSFVFFFKPSF
jgi:hypothetical protein